MGAVFVALCERGTWTKATIDTNTTLNRNHWFRLTAARGREVTQGNSLVRERERERMREKERDGQTDIAVGERVFYR